MIVLITGSSRGIGLEFVIQYLKEGYEVIATCRDPNGASKLHNLESSYGDKLTIIQLEVSDAESRNRAFTTASEKFKKLDILINNAGIASGDEKDNYPFGVLKTEDISKVFSVNTIAPLLVVEKFLKLIEKGENPKIINITSALASISSKNFAFRYSYSASKTALNMFSKMLSLELKPKGITVIPLHPGHVKTDLGGYSAPLTPEESVEGMIKVIKLLTIEDSGRFLNWRGMEVPW